MNANMPAVESEITRLQQANADLQKQLEQSEGRVDQLRWGLKCMEGGMLQEALLFPDSTQYKWNMWWIREIRRILAASPAPEGDDRAQVEHRLVSDFAPVMLAKLESARLKGRGGWEKPEECTIMHLWDCLHEHVNKPNLDMVDVSNIAAMIWHRLNHNPGEREQLQAHLVTTSNALQQELKGAVQTLVDVVQHFGGEVGMDWSAYRVGFGYGVCRGEGNDPGQQIVSAVRGCLALRVPPRFTPSINWRDPKWAAPDPAQAQAGGES